MEPTAADVMPKAILSESLAVRGGTPIEQAARAAGQRIIDKAKQGQWREAIDARSRINPIEQRKIDEKAEEIGVERDAAGKKVRGPGSEEQVRFDRVKDAANLAKKLVEQGYDKLSLTEKGELKTIIENKIKSNPLLVSEFNSLSAAAQTNEIERRLRDPKFLADLSEIVNGHLSEQKLLDEDLIKDRKNEVDQKEYEKTEAENEVNELTGKITAIDTSLKDFDRSPAGSGVGAKAVELDALRSSRSTIEAELQTHKETLDNANVRLQDLINERKTTLELGATGRRDAGTIDADIVTKRREIQTSQREVNTREKKISRITELETEESKMKEDKLNAENEKRDKSNDLRKAELEWSKAQRRLNDLQRERVYEEEDLANGMENSFAKAADKYIADEIEAMKTKVEAGLEEDKKKTSDQNEKAMYDALKDRWMGKEKGFGRYKYRPIDKNRTVQDFMRVRDNGPEFLMKDLLQSRRDSAGRRIYTDPQIDALLADRSDGSFYKKMEPEVAKQLISRKILAGGIKAEDLYIIGNTQWGNEVVKQALEKNKEFRTQLEAAMGEGAIKSPGFFGKFGEQIKKHPWWLALILGIPFLAIGAATAGAKDFNIVK